MMALNFLIFCGLGALLLFLCTKIKGCDSGMRMLNADWLEPGERFKLVSRWGVRL